ncbi:TIGR00282 family metallophosphoesterase [Pelotomaculum propionicicum]|uniref:TIGR00282 family metallophosphoesterase n=1 Tax=Pelotomaculum propionicicum TaxID=258475 RepID=UPI003B80D438
MRLLIIGDIVGRSGRRAVKVNVGSLRKEFNLDFVIANGENAAGGKGITEDTARELFSGGVDMLTMGNHVWNKREAFEYIDRETRIVRPANYPPGSPGLGWAVYDMPGHVKVGVINLAGRIFQEPLDCPFRKADEIIARIKDKARIVIVDFHAEATSEKVAMGWYLAGRVSAVVGTHTHVQTADERILPGGTAYITDLGMTGPMDSVIGVKKEAAVGKFITQIPQYFEVATGPFQFNAALIEVSEDTGEAVSIQRIQNYE